jgi:hypothetical protein
MVLFPSMASDYFVASAGRIVKCLTSESKVGRAHEGASRTGTPQGESMNKVTLSAISTLGCLSLAAMTAEARVVQHYKTNGAFASFSAYGEGKDYISFSVSKGGSTQAPETYASYYSSDCDWEIGLCQGINAFGKIPNQDFVASSKSAALNTNTAGNPDFHAYAWSYNSYTGEYSESPVSLGAIDLSWKSSGEHTSKFVGTMSDTYLNFTWKSTGQSSQSHATVTGTIGGEPVNGFYSYIGTNSNNDRYNERN